MALVSVYGDVVTGTQASCIFHDGDDALPPPTAARAAGCASLDGLSLQLPLLGDENDRSGNEHTVTLHGAVVDENGARFDGSGDSITVSSFDYYSDASFSISYWMTKEGCTSGVYEYVYSHQQAGDLDLLHPANSNV